MTAPRAKLDADFPGQRMRFRSSTNAEDLEGFTGAGPYTSKSGAVPAFYISLQRGEGSVVLRDPGTTTDAFLQHWDAEGQRTQYFSYSNAPLVGRKETVLTTAQISELGAALAKICGFFAQAYAQGPEWSMDVGFKFDALPGECPTSFIKQARPFGGPISSSLAPLATAVGDAKRSRRTGCDRVVTVHRGATPKVGVETGAFESRTVCFALARPLLGQRWTRCVESEPTPWRDYATQEPTSVPHPRCFVHLAST